MPAAFTEQLRLRPSALAASLTLCAAAALAVAVLLRRAELVAFAAPILGALLTAAGAKRTVELRVGVEPDTCRLFAGETARVHVVATVRPGCDGVHLAVAPTVGVDVLDRHDHAVLDGAAGTWSLRARTWGRFSLPLRITVHARAGLLTASTGQASAPAIRLRAYPEPRLPATPPRSADLADRIGANLTHLRGEGVEFAGIRPYVPGDRLRTVNWHATARLRRLHVTERLTERASDVVALIDTSPAEAVQAGDTRGGPVALALERSVEAATQVASAALRHGDRAGVLALGYRLRWLGPDMGRRQFYRVADTVLDALPAADDPPSRHADTHLVPRGVLPAGTVLLAFTPLLDARVTLALHDARLRGYAVAAIDVLTDMPQPPAERPDPIVARLWRLERRGMHRNLASLGIPVLPWRDTAGLDEMLQPLVRRPLRTHRPRRTR